MRVNLQAIEGFPNISIGHTEAETRPTLPGILGGLGGGNQCYTSAEGRERRTTHILRQSDAPRGQDEVSNDRKGGACPGPHNKTDAPLLPKAFNHCKDRLPHL